MTYLNLMERRKADLECGDDSARKADLALADEWTQKVLGARKANELKKEQKAGVACRCSSNFLSFAEEPPQREALLFESRTS